MRTSAVATLFLCILLIVSGCTTVTTQTSVVSQAGAGAGGSGVAVRTSSQIPAQPQGELLTIEKWTTTLVMARAVPKLGEVREITDTFNFEGRIFVHATLSSKPGVHGGQPAFEVKWYSADKLVSIQKAQYMVGKSPYYLASSTSGMALGAGKARVELLANGVPLASKEFQVTEK